MFETIKARTEHLEEERRITDTNLRGTLKELAQLDGAFVISEEGIVVSACRYLDVSAKDAMKGRMMLRIIDRPIQQ